MDLYSIVPKFKMSLNNTFNKDAYIFDFDSFLSLEKKILTHHSKLVINDNTIVNEFINKIEKKYPIQYFLEYLTYKYSLGIDVKIKDLISFFIGERIQTQITNDNLYKENNNYQRLKKNMNNNIILRCRAPTINNTLQNDTFILIIDKLIDLLQYDIQTLTIDCYYYFFPGMIHLILYISSFFSTTMLRCMLSINFTAVGHFIVFHKPIKDLSILRNSLKKLVKNNINILTGFMTFDQTERMKLIKFLTMYYKKYVKIKEPFYLKYQDKFSKENFINLSIQFAKKQYMNILKYNMEPNKMMESFLQKFENFNLINIGEKTSINSSITMTEGEIVSSLINKYNLSNILEIGMGYGIITIYILLTFLKKTNKGKINNFLLDHNNEKSNNTINLYELSNNTYQPKLISIDQYQESHWQNIGRNLVKKYSLEQYHSLKIIPSEIKLPKYYKKQKKFDLIFMHHTNMKENILVDVYYAIKLLKNNGFMIINNSSNYSRSIIINYIEFNFKHLVKQDCKANTLVIFKCQA